ncbi:unnamed protein product [Nezara viridula]|uniref:Uncharacterized protein n=1 Tax=Nezara viridula TaxID=85310 RepID=A0A9P0E6Z0_NEZVI|nr:unnamed protein product [Nezara viridula]
MSWIRRPSPGLEYSPHDPDTFKGDVELVMNARVETFQVLLSRFDGSRPRLVYCGQYPLDWPLSVHGRLCVHLGSSGPGSLLPGDGYLALTPRLSIESRAGPLSLPPVLSPQGLMADLPALLRALVVSAERSLARFPLEELAYPCSNCGRAPETCNCHAVERRDSGIQTSPMYEMDSSIPHIDSDDEHENVTRSEYNILLTCHYNNCPTY